MMTDFAAECMREEPRFSGLGKFEHKIWLSPPVVHGEGLEYAPRAYGAGCTQEAGEIIGRLERVVAAYAGVGYAAALNSGTAAVHLAVKLAAERVYGSSSGISTPDGPGAGGCLYRRKVFCPAFAPAAAVSPVIYEGGEPVFIDASLDDWGMDPQALELAFRKYPDVKIVVFAHLYGFPGQIGRIKQICERHGALLVEDASECLGAKYKGKPAGGFGDYGIYSFGGNKIITGSCGGALLTNDAYSADKARRWASQSCGGALWGQHEELGYSYRMGGVIAGIVLGQWGYLERHIAEKKRIYHCYAEMLEPLGVELNPYDAETVEPSYWMPCMCLDKNSLCAAPGTGEGYTYRDEHGRTCPREILEALKAFDVQGRPVWKPVHLQPMYRSHDFISVDGGRRASGGCYSRILERVDESSALYSQAVCLPSDIRMSGEELGQVVEIIYACFSGRKFERLGKGCL